MDKETLITFLQHSSSADCVCRLPLLQAEAWQNVLAGTVTPCLETFAGEHKLKFNTIQPELHDCLNYARGHIFAFAFARRPEWKDALTLAVYLDATANIFNEIVLDDTMYFPYYLPFLEINYVIQSDLGTSSCSDKVRKALFDELEKEVAHCDDNAADWKLWSYTSNSGGIYEDSCEDFIKKTENTVLKIASVLDKTVWE